MAASHRALNRMESTVLPQDRGCYTSGSCRKASRSQAPVQKNTYSLESPLLLKSPLFPVLGKGKGSLDPSLNSFPPGDSPDALEERPEDAESWEQDRSLFTGLLFSEVQPVSKHTHLCKRLEAIAHRFSSH